MTHSYVEVKDDCVINSWFIFTICVGVFINFFKGCINGWLKSRKFEKGF